MGNTVSGNDYQPPKVWKWEQESGGKFASINRPVAGATHDKELPVEIGRAHVWLEVRRVVVRSPQVILCHA